MLKKINDAQRETHKMNLIREANNKRYQDLAEIRAA